MHASSPFDNLMGKKSHSNAKIWRRRQAECPTRGDSQRTHTIVSKTLSESHISMAGGGMKGRKSCNLSGIEICPAYLKVFRIRFNFRKSPRQSVPLPSHAHILPVHPVWVGRVWVCAIESRDFQDTDQTQTAFNSVGCLPASRRERERERERSEGASNGVGSLLLSTGEGAGSPVSQIQAEM